MAKKEGMCMCGSSNCKCGLMWGWLFILFGLIGLYSLMMGGDGLIKFSQWWPAIFVVWGLKKVWFGYRK
jgi:hypothetical protein